MALQSNRVSGSYRWLFLGLMVFVLIGPVILPALSGKRSKYETIEATAVGTGAQMGQMMTTTDPSRTHEFLYPA
jgi:hypothetical protein